MRQKNIIAAVFLIALAIIYGVLTAYLPLRTLPNTPDPAFFPWINATIILVLSICLLVRGLRQPVTAPPEVDRQRQRKAIGVMGAFIIYLAAMPTLGFILATLPFFAIMMFLFGEQRPVPVVGGSIAMTFALYFVFRHAFGVYLPRGLLAGIIA